MKDAPTDISWGTDGVVSMPEPLESTDVAMADMQGFCFTPDGLRVNVSRAEREDIIGRGFGPQGGPGAQG